MTRRIVLALLVVVAVGTGTLSYQRVQAARAMAQVADICAQIPALTAALDYTFTTWPRVGDASLQASTDYFAQSVRSDAAWCSVNASALPADDTVNTMLWHFGKASEYLRQYQAAAKGAPVATATMVSALPTMTATPIPPVVTPTPTIAPETPTPQPTATVAPSSLNVRLFFGEVNFAKYGPGDFTCPNVARRTSVLKQGSVGVYFEWTGKGAVATEWFREGQPFYPQYTHKMYTLNGPSGCNDLGLMDNDTGGILNFSTQPLMPVGSYNIRLTVDGRVIQDAPLLVVPK